MKFTFKRIEEFILSLDKNTIKTFSADSAYIFTNIFPLALSMAVCSGLGAASGILASAIACLLVACKKNNLIMPVYTAYLISAYTFSEYGLPTLTASVALSGAAMIALAFLGFDFKRIVFKPVTVAIMLATAISVTVIETNNYFGIGATGNIVNTILRSYRSFGFHPNWRGVLYGTIVMVIMITYPRKFKKADKTVRAPFVALLGTLVLNFLINPVDLISPIEEVGAVSTAIKPLLLPTFNGGIDLVGVLTSGFSLFIMTAYSVSEFSGSNLDYASTGAANCLCSAVAGAFIPVTTHNYKRISYTGIPAAVLSILIFLFLGKFIARIPVASCAVVLIVGAWQSVKWSEIKRAFIDVPSLGSFIAVVFFMLLFGAVKGVLFGALCSFICSVFVNSQYAEQQKQQEQQH